MTEQELPAQAEIAVDPSTVNNVDEAVSEQFLGEEIDSNRENQERTDVISDSDKNWREMRQIMKEQKDGIMQRDQEISELKNAVFSIKNSMEAQTPGIDDDDGLSTLAGDDIPTKNQVEKLVGPLVRRVTREMIQQKDKETVEERLNLKFSDYAEVVSAENVKRLVSEEPELSMSLKVLGDDPFKQGIAAYKLLKKMGIATPKEDRVARENSARLDQNFSKPQSINSIAKTSPLSHANDFSKGFTKADKARLYQEMKESRKRF